LTADLKIGTTQTVLKRFGKMPRLGLSVKIWARGVAIFKISCLIKLMLMPSTVGQGMIYFKNFY
jgi:hypothetical protein